MSRVETSATVMFRVRTEGVMLLAGSSAYRATNPLPLYAVAALSVKRFVR